MRIASKGLGLVARVVVTIASLVFIVIAIGILLLVLDANPGNPLVQGVNSAAGYLAGPFNGLFTFRDSEVETTTNWAIAAFVWLLVGALVAGVLRRLSGRRRRRGRA